MMISPPNWSRPGGRDLLRWLRRDPRGAASTAAIPLIAIDDDMLAIVLFVRLPVRRQYDWGQHFRVGLDGKRQEILLECYPVRSGSPRSPIRARPRRKDSKAW